MVEANGIQFLNEELVSCTRGKARINYFIFPVDGAPYQQLQELQEENQADSHSSFDDGEAEKRKKDLVTIHVG